MKLIIDCTPEESVSVIKALEGLTMGIEDSHAETYRNLLREKLSMINLIEISRGIIDAGKEKESSKDLLDKAEQKIADIRSSRRWPSGQA